jgi:hypothetical protein
MGAKRAGRSAGTAGKVPAPQIHVYAALLTLVNLLVYAMAGIAPRALPAAVVWEQPFTVQPGETDRAVAERVVTLLNLSLATPVHNFNIGHDRSGRLMLDFYHANGRHKITVFEDRLHIENSRAAFARYLSTLHVTTAAFRSGDARMTWWSWYNEFAMWTLIVMLATGVWMLVTRRGKPGAIRRTHWITALVSAPLLALFAFTAVQMAHRTAAVLPAINALHRSRVVAPFASAALLILTATGIVLWFNGRDRRTGAALLTFGALVSGGLILWMRAG